MGKTHKDAKSVKAERGPKIQQKQYKNNYLQNLTRNADMFMDSEDEDLDLEVEETDIEDIYSGEE